MRNSRGGTPANAKKGQRNNLSSAEKNSATKKLVQARLPFKVIAPGSPSAADEGSVETQISGKSAKKDVENKISTEKRKRKLSYESDSGDKAKDLTHNVSKENVKVQEAAKKKKKTDSGTEEVIILLDDDAEESCRDSSDAAMDTSASTSQTKTKLAAKTPKLAVSKKSHTKGAGTPKTSSGQKSKNGSGTKLTIKLPTGKKNKRKKSNVNSLAQNISSSNDMSQETILCVDSSDDMEAVATELNPQKRTKLNFEAEDGNAKVVNNENMESITEKANKGADQNSTLVASTVQKMVEDKLAPGDDIETEIENNSTTNKISSTTSEEHRISDKVASSTDEQRVQADQEESTKVNDESFLSPNDIVDICYSDDAEADEDADDETETQSRNVSVVNDENLKSTGNNTIELHKNPQSEKHKNLTPKQKKLMERRLLARQEKELKLLEEKKRKQQEKEEKELAKKREREEKEDLKRKEREEKEEVRRKEQEEKERKRLAEIEAKNEEKRKKIEAKEEEMRKREEERKRKELEKEEAELKKKKAAQAFTKFFVPKGSSNNQPNIEKDENTDDGIKLLAFRPFQIKGDMKLAPVCRKILTPEAKNSMESQIGCYESHNSSETNQMDSDDQYRSKTSSSSERKLYLQELKSGQIVPGKWRRPSTDLKDDVILVEDELERVGQEIVEDTPAYVGEEMRVKFYKFYDNRRPPYYGTFRKKSLVVSGRKPFAQDKIFCDYDVDSDDEWEEEEEPGESLEDGSDEDKEKESDDDYEVDNEWFVPHGHLSDEELQNEDECEMGSENTREAQKVKLHLIQQEFAQEMKKKTEKIKPRLIGCIWADVSGNQPQLCPNLIWQTLGKASMLFTNPPEVEESKCEEPTSPQVPNAEIKLKPLVITDEMTKHLIRLVHGNTNSRDFLIKEYMAFLKETEPSIKNGEFSNLAKSAVRDLINSIAEWQILVKGNAIDATSKNKKIKKHLCWIVHTDMLTKMNMSSLKLDNAWEYILTPKKKGAATKEVPESLFVNDDTHKADDTVAEKAKTERMDNCHSEQIAKDATTPKAEKKLKSPGQSPPAKKEKMSATRGSQPISTHHSKNKLISQFLQKGKKDSKSSASQKPVASAFAIVDDDIIALD